MADDIHNLFSAATAYLVTPFDMCRAMRNRLSCFLFLMLVVATPVVAGVENQVKDLVEAGEIMPFEGIRNRVLAEVRGDYIGAEFDAATRTYRFRFLTNGNVINVDVNARTGQKTNRTRNY